MNPLLEVKDVCLSYHSLSGETAALSHISFHLMPEEFLAVVGPSGCGKSTLLNLICGLLHAESGTILMNGKPLNKDSARIGYMLQKDHLLEWRSIYRNVLLGLEIKGELTKDNLSYVDELLKLYELDKFRNSRPSQLSGGMRQRVMIAMALTCNPSLLIADEPTTALDVTIQLQIMQLLKRLRDESGMAILLITHDIGLVTEMADRVVVMYAGECVEETTTQQLLEAPAHPYTQALLRAVPGIHDPKDRRLYSIPGTVPEEYQDLPGCRFAPRCPYGRECSGKQEEREISPGHVVRCCRAQEGREAYGA